MQFSANKTLLATTAAEPVFCPMTVARVTAGAVRIATGIIPEVNRIDTIQVVLFSDYNWRSVDRERVTAVALEAFLLHMFLVLSQQTGGICTVVMAR